MTTASGLKIQIHKKGTGKNAASGDVVRVHYTGMLTDSTIFDSSVGQGRDPLLFPLGKGRVIKGWDEGITYLNPGAKATLIIPAGLAYGEKGIPNVIPPNSTLIFKVELLEIIPKLESFNFDITGKEKIKSNSGLEYVVVENGKGMKVDSGKVVELHYTGRLEDGKVFDCSRERVTPFKFKTGARMVIPGFDEGVMKLHVGDKARLLIPSAIGYGAQGNAVIPANSNLIFDVEILNVN
ncbi:MAG: hypothetical protein A3H98_05030 [Bacteroidetes bacterium RIFCSPLOWO2_02_FULL_36_8]|nr:MAG: hypothetical protein A3H98_05030 [Bacteroidetes bacterium RIFCSPLOWO2_02_FULL_36_8]OFY70507.1 MAG: hypothetical protein A3G23_08675 [Bacteroidetes bacterium RIFCSPLOWO2_12_FULL_37_12]